MLCDLCISLIKATCKRKLSFLVYFQKSQKINYIRLANCMLSLIFLLFIYFHEFTSTTSFLYLTALIDVNYVWVNNFHYIFLHFLRELRWPSIYPRSSVIVVNLEYGFIYLYFTHTWTELLNINNRNIAMFID